MDLSRADLPAHLDVDAEAGVALSMQDFNVGEGRSPGAEDDAPLPVRASLDDAPLPVRVSLDDGQTWHEIGTVSAGQHFGWSLIAADLRDLIPDGEDGWISRTRWHEVLLHWREQQSAGRELHSEPTQYRRVDANAEARRPYDEYTFWPSREEVDELYPANPDGYYRPPTAQDEELRRECQRAEAVTREAEDELDDWVEGRWQEAISLARASERLPERPISLSWLAGEAEIR